VKRLFERIATASGKRPWLVLTLIGLITVAAVIGALFIELEFSQRALLPEGYDSIATVKDVEEDFGGIMYDKVLLTGIDFASAKGARDIYDYTEALKASSDPKLWGIYVLRADSYISQLARDPQAEPVFQTDDYLSNLGLSIAVQEYLDSPARDFVMGKTITPDGSSALINVQVNPDLSQSQTMDYAVQLREFTEDFFADRGIQAEVSGETLIMKDIQDMSLRDGLILGLIALIFIIVVLFLTFRRVLDVALTLGVVLISMVWVFGLMGAAGIQYTIMSIAIIPLLLGIGIDYAIHILTRYYEERGKGADARLSISSSMVTVGVAVFLTAATTMFGFLSFFISNMPPMRDFGLLCLSGVFFSFLLSITMLPAALVIRDRHSESKVRAHKENRLLVWVDKGLVKLSLLAERHRWVVGTAVLSLVVVCIILAVGLSTSADFRTFVPQDMPSYASITRIEDTFGGQDTAVALVEGDNVLAPESLQSMNRFTEVVLADPRNRTPDGFEVYFQSNRVNSLPGLFMAINGSLPTSTQEAEVMLVQMEEEYGFDTSALVTADRSKALVAFDVLFVDEEGQKEMAETLKASASEMNSSSSLDFRVTGTPLITSDTLGTLFSTQLNTAGLALLLCGLLVILVFRSIYYGLATASVVFLAIVFELGILRIIGWPLDIMTVMIASLVIGVGIDFGIHVTHRFREEVYERGQEPEGAINTTVRNVGSALIPAAITTCGAFLILAISQLSVLRRFGVITAIALLSALFASLVIQPSFLAFIALRKKRAAEKKAARSRSREVVRRSALALNKMFNRLNPIKSKKADFEELPP
jgi:predicted RND superfamily exporter protein